MFETKIPKKIHYVWLGGKEMPELIVKCMNSWKTAMPEYELVLWDENKFDINSSTVVKEACEAGKWAFASDYIRLYALYTEGGIYFDTDVFVKRSFNDFLDHDFFSAVEYHEKYVKHGAHMLNADGTMKDEYKGTIFTHGIQIQAAIMGGVKGHPFLKSCLDWYEGKHFSAKDWADGNQLLSPYIYAHVAEAYGFKYKNELQKLSHGMTIYPSSVFAGHRIQIEEDTYAVHYCDGSWRNFREKIKFKLRTNNFLRMLLGKKKIPKSF